MRTRDPTANGFVVSTKQPPGPRSVVRVEKRAPDPSSTTSADAVNIWRPEVRRSDSFNVVVGSLTPRYVCLFQLSGMLACPLSPFFCHGVEIVPCGGFLFPY